MFGDSARSIGSSEACAACTSSIKRVGSNKSRRDVVSFRRWRRKRKKRTREMPTMATRAAMIIPAVMFRFLLLSALLGTPVNVLGGMYEIKITSLPDNPEAFGATGLKGAFS